MLKDNTLSVNVDVDREDGIGLWSTVDICNMSVKVIGKVMKGEGKKREDKKWWQGNGKWWLAGYGRSQDCTMGESDIWGQIFFSVMWGVMWGRKQIVIAW